MNRFLNAIGRSVLTVLTIVLIVYGWAFFEMKIMLKSNPELFGFIFVQYKSDDMMPDFNEDDIVIVRKNSKIESGTYVMYLSNNSEYLVRKVVSTNNYSSTLACNSCGEEHVSTDNSTILGRAVGKIAFFGKFINFFKQKWFLTTLAVIGFILVAVSQYIHETPKKVN